MNPFFQKLRSLMHRRRKEDDLRDELQFHLDEETEERQAEGLPGDEARHAARRDIGSIALVQEETRAVWTWTYLEQLAQDCRYAVRTMAANKTFSMLAILSLALGIGANTAIYSFMDSLLLRSLPVSDPESLAVLNWGANPTGRDFVMRGMSGSTWSDEKWAEIAGIFPFPAFELIRTNSGAVFSSVFAYYPTRKVNVMVKAQAEQASGEFVSGDYFRGLEVSPAAGRLIIPDDDRVGAPAIAVLSFAFSQRRFGDAASAPGQSILINNVPFTVAGVAPPGFFGVDPAAAPDFYVPLRTNLLLRLRGGATRCRRISRTELLLARNDGAPASGREPHASAGRAGPGVSPMGCHHGQRSRARDASRTADPGGRDGTQYAAAAVLETFVCVAGHGGADPGDCMHQHREPAAGESDCAQARNGGAAQHGRGTIPRDPPTFDGERAAGVDRWRLGSSIRDMGDSISYVPAGERKRRFHSASNLELARAGRGLGAIASHGTAVRTRPGASVDASRCDSRPERGASGSARRAAFVPAHQPEPVTRRNSNRHLPADARCGGTVRANVVESAIDPVGIQSRKRAAVPDERAAGGTSGSGDHHVLQRFAKAVQRDSRGARRKRLPFAVARARHVVGTRRAGRPAAKSGRLIF